MQLSGSHIGIVSKSTLGAMSRRTRRHVMTTAVVVRV
jgi:hypothetical protein